MKNRIKFLFDFCVCFKALVHESLKLFAVAGLLTYSHFEPPSRIKNTVAKDKIMKIRIFRSVKMLHGTYSNGLVQDFHLIPSSSTILNSIAKPLRVQM